MPMKQKHPTNRLKEIRIAKGLTQKKVTELMELECQNRLSRWERGMAVPNVKNLLRLCAIYNISPQEVYEIIKASTKTK